MVKNHPSDWMETWGLPTFTDGFLPSNHLERRAKTPRMRVVRWWLQHVAQIYEGLCCAIEEYVSPWTPISQRHMDCVRMAYYWQTADVVVKIPFEFGPLQEWDTFRVDNMSGMFCDSNFNVDLSRWDTSNVTNMSNMFRNCKQFNGNISTWNVGNVTDMSGMFAGCSNFNQPIGGWNTHRVRSMNEMFANTNMFNQDISGWNVGQVESMESMFLGALSFNQPIATWDVSNVKCMNTMFAWSQGFNQPLDAWQVPKDTNVLGAFYGTALHNQPRFTTMN